MSKKNAEEFAEMLSRDETLRERLKQIKPGENRAFAKEMGLDFTEEELEEAMSIRPLSPEEMDEVAGGGLLDPVKDFITEAKCKLFGHNSNVIESAGAAGVNYFKYRCTQCGKVFLKKSVNGGTETDCTEDEYNAFAASLGLDI